MQQPGFDPAFQAQFADLLRWRRDVRRFRPDPVPALLLQSLLDVAALAPSVGLSQPWRFVAVDDPDRRAAVRASFEACNAGALNRLEGPDALTYASLKLAGLDEAPCQLAVFADPQPEQGRGLGRMTMPETTAYSAVMAVHTLWLAARVAGLGMGWVSILEPTAVTAALDLPADWRFIGYFCIGVPALESDTPELERSGWQRRSDPTTPLLQR